MTAPLGRPRRQRILTWVVVGLVSAAAVAVVGLVVHTTVQLGRLATDVSTGQQRATNLSNAQRDALLLVQQLGTPLGARDTDEVELRRGLLLRQLDIVAHLYPEERVEFRALQRWRATLETFPWTELADEPVRVRSVALARDVEARLRALYGVQESAFYDATLASLSAKRSSHYGLTALVALVLALGAGTTVWLSRRAKGDLREAYDALRRKSEEREALAEQLTHQAYHDGLTGLPNRALCMREPDTALRAALSGGGSLAVVLIDLDGFKDVNDTLGHAAGDELLRRAAERLRGAVLDGDTVARLGGDEFAIVIPGGTRDSAVAVSTRVIAALRRPIGAGGQEVRVGASIGVAVQAAPTGATADELLADADIAMYEAKKNGKGRYRVFEPAMRERTQLRTQLERDLAAAVAAARIEVHYQPIASLASRRVTAVEALARWRRPDGSYVEPSVFIPVAEQTGLIDDIGHSVLLQACTVVAGWRTSVPGCADLGVTVNVSGWQILAADYAGQVASVLAATGLPAAALTLEITESMLLEDSDGLVGQLSRLKDLGVRLAMDDFGAGYSSLSSLLRFPVDMLKIDRIFLELGSGPRGSLVRAVAELGRTLDLTVVAEGVETPRQLELARAARCDAVQGFLLSAPLPPAEAGRYLEWAAAVPALIIAAP